tara:strand:- start:215 stop:1063 length:849 start_codon:yes stop_codon:yes gene_type:complete
MQLSDAPAKDAIAPDAIEPSRPAPASGGMGLGDDLLMALRFFSRLPTGDSPHQKPELNRIAMALPLASLVIGLGPALLLIGASFVGLPAYFAAALAVAAQVLVSGAMAEDALADAADGLFGGHSPARRLEIMKDSRHGTYGVSALSLFLLLRVTGLGAVAAINPLAAGAIWLAAGIVGRSGALWLAVALPAARPDGIAAAAGAVSGRSFAVGAVFAVLLTFVLAGPATNMLALGFVLVTTLAVIAGWTALCRRLVGGQSGDLIGALGGLLEIAVLATLLAFV